MFRTLIKKSLFHTKRNNYLRYEELELLKTNREKLEVLNKHTYLLLSIEELSKKTWDINQDILSTNEKLLQNEYDKWIVIYGITFGSFLNLIVNKIDAPKEVEKHIEDCDIINS
jgi:hypothetical protein